MKETPARQSSRASSSMKEIENFASEDRVFRPMRRFKQQLSEEECVAILKEGHRGFLSLIGEGGYPYTIPINFVYEEGHIYFHSAKNGHKMDAIKNCDKACFTVIGDPVQEPDDWWYHVKSVICRGRISVIEDGAEHLSKLRLLGSKYFPEGRDMEEDIRRNGPGAAVLDLRIEHISGKRVKEK